MPRAYLETSDVGTSDARILIPNVVGMGIRVRHVAGGILSTHSPIDVPFVSVTTQSTDGSSKTAVFAQPEEGGGTGTFARRAKSTRAPFFARSPLAVVRGDATLVRYESAVAGSTRFVEAIWEYV